MGREKYPGSMNAIAMDSGTAVRSVADDVFLTVVVG